MIGPNGSGKSSLLKILAGKDKSDTGGKITFLKDIRIAFLEQDSQYDPQAGVLEWLLASSRELTRHYSQEHLFEHELKIKRLLTSFGLCDHEVKMKNLSGGERKRVFLTGMLASDADFFIMDEPTNHLDIDAIEYLEAYLKRARCTLLMVTHDRYFLDRVCNTVIEIDQGSLFSYKGDYETYLEKRQERIGNYNAETDKVRNILRRELEWMRSTPCARSGKSKYRKEAFYQLKERAEQAYKIKSLDMSDIGSGSRLGTKIINCKSLSFSYGDRTLIKDFTYNFQRFEKVGIVGKNGAGKTTFLNLICGLDSSLSGGQMSGEISRGESLNIGYYHQGGMSFDEELTVLETVNDTRLLSRFLFPHDMLNNKVSTLSGGEKRRLYLLSILMRDPNLLILDEPTNDLDIVTLNILEEYLLSFKGSLIIVSHDRHFLDRLADHLFIFLGDGEIKDFIGRFSEYREYIKTYEANLKEEAKPEKTSYKPQRQREEKKKLTFKEKRELEELEKALEDLNQEKGALELKMHESGLEYDELQSVSQRYSEIQKELDAKEMRWLELSDI